MKKYGKWTGLIGVDFNKVFRKTSIIFFAAQKALGRKVLLPKINELFLDIDSEHDYQLMKDRLETVHDLIGYDAIITYDKPSASGLPKRHVIVSLDIRYKDTEWLNACSRSVIQMYLCSDPRREMHTIREVILKSDYPCLFVEGGKWNQGLWKWAKEHKNYIKAILGKV